MCSCITEKKEKSKQTSLHQTKECLHKKEIINKTKRQPTKREKISANRTSNKGYCTIYIRNSYNLTLKKTNNEIKKMNKRPE